ncbi:MAG: hypothetical protein V7K88_14490 [Nostoc sp.]|uniref:hypothetical protein n=1 Tax=Nostoc sp. TaxID=1180 RepID=UPI002FFA54A7
MPNQDKIRRLGLQVISRDVNSFQGLQTVSTYDTTDSNASVANIQQAYQAMLPQQQAETDKLFVKILQFKVR